MFVVKGMEFEQAFGVVGLPLAMAPIISETLPSLFHPTNPIRYQTSDFFKVKWTEPKMSNVPGLTRDVPWASLGTVGWSALRFRVAASFNP